MRWMIGGEGERETESDSKGGEREKWREIARRWRIRGALLGGGGWGL